MIFIPLLIVVFVLMVLFWGTHLTFFELVKSLAFALFIGAPVGGILGFGIALALVGLCTFSSCDGMSGAILAHLFGIIGGGGLGAIIGLIMRMRGYENTRNQSLAYDEKRKNDEKVKRS